MIRIVELQLKILKRRLSEHDIEISFDNKVKEKIIEEGFAPEYGARPLKRTIQRLIENPLAKFLLESKPAKIDIELKKGEIAFSPH
jgi:ATP-dependent Clp protease ATP-binding subunit ClpA